MNGTLVSRVVRFYRREGLPALLRELCVRPYRRLVLDWHYVFVCEQVPEVPPPPMELELRHYRSAEALDAEVRRSVVGELGAHMGRALDEALAGGAELFVACVSEAVAALQFVRPGRAVDHWFVPLRPNDAVLFGGTTLPRFRRRGLVTWMIRHQTHYAMQGGGRAYADVKVWNTPAIRAVESAGFRRIARMRPLRSGS